MDALNANPCQRMTAFGKYQSTRTRNLAEIQ